MDAYIVPVAMLVLVVVCNCNQADDSDTIEIHMPGIQPRRDDEYWCYSYHVTEETRYITQFEALAEGDVAHHMLVFGCQSPAEHGKAWKCGSNLCSRGSAPSKIVFAWARNAPPTKLPKDVGFKIGGSSGVNYLIIQIHYRRKFLPGEDADISGVKLTVTETPQQYNAGVLLMLSTHLTIPAHSQNIHSNISCQYKGDADIHPFAFRTHAHSLSTVITGYKYNDSYHLLGKGNPQWPQAFYPMKHVETIKPYDFLVAQCTYDSTNSDKTTRIGATHNDEMCNFYMMYYTSDLKVDTFLECYDDERPDLSKNMPADSYNPPPYNEELDMMAEGHHHHHGGDANEEEPGHTDTDNLLALQDVSVVKDWPTIKDTDELVLGQIGGVATDSEGHIHVFHRGSRVWDSSSFNSVNDFLGKDPIKENTLVTFDTAGNVIEQWGNAMFYMPHGIYIDDNDNIWVTDVAMHQVMRFPNNTKKPDLVLGKKLQRGSDKSHFCKPADVAVLPSGEFFVADGYCNHRIVKFNKDGEYVMQWGRASKTIGEDGFPPPITFDIPHSLANIPNHDSLCVADRENGRIQCFDYEGMFLKQIHIAEFGGRLFAITYCPDLDIIYAVNGEQTYKATPKVSGFALKYNTGKLLQMWGPGEEGFKRPHDITVANDGTEIYVGEIGPNKLWKFSVNISEILASHKTIKRPGLQTAHHPESIDSSSEEDKTYEMSEEPDFGVSIVIAALLIVPVLVIIVIVVFLRVRRRSTEIGYKLVLPEDEDDYDSENDLWVKSKPTNKKVSFNPPIPNVGSKFTSTSSP